MGGIYSGRHYRERRLTTNDVHSIDIRTVGRPSLLSEQWGRVSRAVRTAPIYIKAHNDGISIGAKTEDAVTLLAHVDITRSSRNFGGSQLYFLCPDNNCEKRVAILYISGKQIACRACSNLSYESQHENIYIRSFRRAKKLRIKIGAAPQPLSPLPDKPKHMHKASYDQITYTLLATELKAINEMKAYLHGKWSYKLHHLDDTLECFNNQPMTLSE